MGFALITGDCFCCRQVFSFNPVRVPLVKDGSGIKQPLCRVCAEAINRFRIKKGYTPFVIPPDAYEACNEIELG